MAQSQRHPYQCIQVCNGFLIAASGPKLLSVNLEDGQIVTEWPQDVKTFQDEPVEDDKARPSKKRKTSNKAPERPIVIKLLAIPSENHVLAVTGEDKCLRVFSVQPSGDLVHVSERFMPKRPCALTMTSDCRTILCGDKFGDVYALPLSSSAEDDASGHVEMKPAPEATNEMYKPSASELTVHSGRNRKALEMQMKHKAQAKTKEPLKFRHELLLGHVSMLTDIAFADTTVEGKRRQYIITSDRDEHIRVSRGPPQSHIVDGYCLGHTDFVNKICNLGDKSQILASGGGDDYVYIWNYAQHRLVGRLNVRAHLKKRLDSDDYPAEWNERVAVSGIWTFDEWMLVAVEGYDHLFFYHIERMVQALCSPSAAKTTDYAPDAYEICNGNVLDVAFVRDSNVLGVDRKKIGDYALVSVDNIHQSRTKTALLNHENLPRLLAFNMTRLRKKGETEMVGAMITILERANSFNTWSVDAASLRDMLYNIEPLRKRAGLEDED